MAKRRKNTQFQIDQLKDDLQELPVRQAIGKTRAGSYHRLQRILGELDDYRASEIAGVLGLRTQKYNALISAIEYSDASTGVLNDLLEQALHELQSRPQEIEEDFSIYDPDARRTYKQHLSTTIEPGDVFADDYPNAREIKHYTHRANALKYLARMPGAVEYFKIVQKGVGKAARYSIYDIRDTSEQGHRTKRSK